MLIYKYILIINFIFREILESISFNKLFKLIPNIYSLKYNIIKFF